MHHCPALNIRCIDFRFRKFTDQYLEKTLGFGDFDLITRPGGIKDLAEKGKGTELFGDIKVSVSLHSPNKIVLTNHIDCGAYGGSKPFSSQEQEEKRHQHDLLKAKEILSAEFPGQEIICVFITKASKAELKAENLKALTVKNNHG